MLTIETTISVGKIYYRFEEKVSIESSYLTKTDPLLFTSFYEAGFTCSLANTHITSYFLLRSKGTLRNEEFRTTLVSFDVTQHVTKSSF